MTRSSPSRRNKSRPNWKRFPLGKRKADVYHLPSRWSVTFQLLLWASILGPLLIPHHFSAWMWRWLTGLDDLSCICACYHCRVCNVHWRFKYDIYSSRFSLGPGTVFQPVNVRKVDLPLSQHPLSTTLFVTANMATDIAPILPQGAGYGVVVGIGFFFALVMYFVSYIQVCLAPIRRPLGPALDITAAEFRAE